jgi:valyl-tRNA synthetase
MEIDKVYEPHRFEPQWAERWIESGVFQPYGAPDAPVFCLVIPPPNVTGSLHMGHMLEHTEIDVTIRWRRMRGDRTLWLPGTDHAGIATQMVVERKLAEEGLSRREMGREAFVRRVWAWKEEYGGNIKRQMKQLGASCDWTRERFTMDPGLSRAVREVFVRLFEKGLIYRGEYMVNWCPRCHTALSDLEVVREETQGNLWHIRYPVKGLDRHLVVATTRPETMLGDTGVAINPADERYREFHGKSVVLPLMNREIPVILDELADPKFGTGVVKVTPAHDPNDFEAGKRHNLEKIKVIGDDGRMTAEAGAYAGIDRFEARRKVIADLEDMGLLQKVEPYPLALGRCQRCKTVVEPLVSTQWFVKTKPLAEPAIRAVEDGRIRITPENYTKTYYEWMYNIRDWCISRQLWWGHRIPAWYCAKCGGVTVAHETPSACSKCGSAEIEQDPDVLDTWFSSALWPFSTLGWPDQTGDLRDYYPTSLLITGFDILFFWVARMVMMGMEFMGDVPFREVYIHALVRDAEGQKMAKTRGNVIDPLVVTEKYGTDAVRMSLLLGAAPGTDILLTEDRMISARAFANKIWNAARFLFLNMERSGVEPRVPATAAPETLEDRWILSRLDACAEAVNRAIEKYRYHEAAQLLWQFIWHEFCDWYVEIKKLRFTENSGLTNDWRNVLYVFEKILRLLHPLMPFLTEELWQRLSSEAERPAFLAAARFPQADGRADEAALREMELIQQITTAVRNLRADMKADPKQQLGGVLYSRSAVSELVRSQQDVIQKLANVKLEIVSGSAPRAEGAARSTPEFDLVLRLPLAQADQQRQRLTKEVEQLDKVIANSRKQLEDQEFLSRAPARVVDSIRTKLADYEAQADKSRKALEALLEA